MRAGRLPSSGQGNDGRMNLMGYGWVGLPVALSWSRLKEWMAVLNSLLVYSFSFTEETQKGPRRAFFFKLLIGGGFQNKGIMFFSSLASSSKRTPPSRY